MQKASYEVEVLVNGKPVKEYSHEGKVFIEGKKGTSFSVRLRNNMGSRKLFVPSIDGVSVMNGESASLGSNGYIVPAYSAITVDGWRTSDEEVAGFYFSDSKHSYATKSGQPGNLGVIGVAVFKEEEKPEVVIKYEYINKGYKWPWRPLEPFLPRPPYWIDGQYISQSSTDGRYSCSSLSLSDSEDVKMSVNYVSQDIGTGWGNTKKSSVVEVEFEKGALESVFSIYYNSREQLQKMGIDFASKPMYVTPQAFPGKYCKPPKSAQESSQD